MADYDVIVVGGGINGCGVAQAAAAAGHRVLLLEKTALAAGTSQWSSKLIHGGLRYLETYQFSMVRESLRERAILLRNAPELVHLTKFFIPIYGETRRQPWLVRSGLSLYALLGGLHRTARFNQVSRSQWDQLDGLNTRGLKAVFQYFDGQTIDSALTRAVMQSACSLGAELRCPARFVAAETGPNATEVHWEENERQHSAVCSTLVNAAGPWVNLVVDKIQPAPTRLQVDLVQGAHIILPGTVERGIYYMESRRDGRAIFVMPWQGRTLVGTTETGFRGNPDTVATRDNERSYLLAVLRHHFPRYADSPIDADFAGLRVLPSGEGHAFHRSRESVLLAEGNPPRILSIYGGKLTTYRATAEKVLRRIAPALPDRQPVADTRTLPLTPAT